LGTSSQPIYSGGGNIISILKAKQQFSQVALVRLRSCVGDRFSGCQFTLRTEVVREI
jgi:hypothetical protein